MLKLFLLFTLIAAVAVTGCAYQTKLLDSKQGLAMETAMKRAQFEMNCPDATGDVLSRTVVALNYPGGYGGPYYSYYYGYPYYGYGSALYTIGVSGCGKQRTYVASCTDGSVGCYAALAQAWDSRYSLAQLKK